MTPKFELGRDFCTMHLPPSFINSFGSYRVDKQTRKHTNKQMPLNIQRSSLRYVG